MDLGLKRIDTDNPLQTRYLSLGIGEEHVDVTGVEPRWPTCAELSRTSDSPYVPLLRYYFGARDVRARLAGGSPLDAKLRAGSHQTDPTAERVARAMLERRLDRGAFEAALAGAPVHDPDLAAWIRDLRRPPPALDFEAAARGARVYLEIAPTVTLPHSIIAGFLFAAMNPNASIPLSLKASIAQATDRRYLRTSTYVADLLRPEGLGFGTAACSSAARVRLVHAFVRAEIDRHYDWNHTAYGAPIHRPAVLVAASVTGTWALLYAERQGFRFSEQEKHDMAMFTAIQAFYQGAPLDSIPLSHADWCDHIFWAVLRAGLPLPEDQARAMSVMQPLLHNGYPFAENRVTTAAFNAMVLRNAWDMLGPDLCRQFAIAEPSPLNAWGLGAAVLTRALALLHLRRSPADPYVRACEWCTFTHLPRMLESAAHTAAPPTPKPQIA